MAIVRKEFLQVLRDRMMLRLVFIMPLVQLLVLGYAINTDVKNINTAVYDYDRSELSREYVRAFSAGDYFIAGASEFPLLEADRGFRENIYNAVLIIPKGFSSSLAQGRKTQVGFMVDGSNANSAAIALGYANMITSEFNKKTTGLLSPISMRQKKLYNPEAEAVYFMVPGIIAVLLTMITTLLTSMAIVREREIGTLEQLMATPVATSSLIIGKIIPFAVIGLIEMSGGLIFGLLWFGIPFVGSIPLFYGMAVIFLFTTLGVGMLISTITKTQQQAMFFAWFFSIFALLMAGFFTPIENMPQSVQYMTYLNPLRYFMKATRAIIMKGAGLSELYPETIAMVLFSSLVFTFAWLRFSKRAK
jgi:ABC-2 type transport system permease protein